MPDAFDIQATLAAIQATRVGVWSWEITSDAVHWSDETLALFERSADEPPPTYPDYLALIPDEDRARVDGVIRGALEAVTEACAPRDYAMEHRIIAREGGTRWLECRGHIEVDAQGRPSRILGTVTDVTSRKELEDHLRAERERAQLFTELASDYVYMADLTRPTIFPEVVAGSFERTTGITRPEVEAAGGWTQFVYPEDRDALWAAMPQLMAGSPATLTYRIVRPDGSIRWVRDAIHPITDPISGKVTRMMGGVQDITDQRRLEAQLAEAQKLEALAQLSGGIAHDFNNLLAVVMGAVGEVAMEPQTPAAQEALEAAMSAAQRGAQLTRSLLAFARRDRGLSPGGIDLRQRLLDTTAMLKRAVGPGVALRVEAGAQPLRARIDPGEVQLMLLNLVVNARDAMPDGGTVTIGLSCIEIDEVTSTLPPGCYARLTVRDEGSGIPEAIMPRIFEPFFTTKASGKGTGLGLPACHGIVQRARGSIRAESEPGRGTTFIIELPLDMGTEATDAPRAHESPGGTETQVLLVEDERQLQRLFARALSDAGFGVTAVDSAEEALDRLAEAPFDLIISDISLPGMRGTELVRRLREDAPAMRAVLISGYATSDDYPEGVPFLEKPFTMPQLLKKVRALLEM